MNRAKDQPIKKDQQVSMGIFMVKEHSLPLMDKICSSIQGWEFSWSRNIHLSRWKKACRGMESWKTMEPYKILQKRKHHIQKSECIN